MRLVRSILFVSVLALAACAPAASRDAHAIATDVDGTVATGTMAPRLLEHADLSQHALVVSVGDVENTYGPGDQPALEQFVREQLALIEGTELHVTQEVLDDTGNDTSRLTLTVASTREGHPHYTGIVAELLRTPRRLVVTRVRISG